jgi:hypothetical protein
MKRQRVDWFGWAIVALGLVLLLLEPPPRRRVPGWAGGDVL